MKFDEIYKKVMDAQRAFEERHIPISLDFKIEDLRDALVESNDTIEKLKQNLEDAKATAYAESVDAGMENRRLKRALWLARADRAIMTLDYFALKCRWFNYMKVEPPKCDVNMVHKWANIERKCRAKAKQYQ